MNGENRAISITIKSFAAGLSAKLERGDIVSLIASDVGEQRKTVIPTELQYLEIIATTTSDGYDNNVQEAPKDGEDTELASTITVLATPEQARLLAELEQTGKLHAALVYRGGSENAQKFLDEQAKVLDELYPKVAAESEETTDESKNSDGAQTPPAGETPDTESAADSENQGANE